MLRLCKSAEIIAVDHPVHLAKGLLVMGSLLLLRTVEARKHLLLHRWQPAFPGLMALSPMAAFRSELPWQVGIGCGAKSIEWRFRKGGNSFARRGDQG